MKKVIILCMSLILILLTSCTYSEQQEDFQGYNQDLAERIGNEVLLAILSSGTWTGDNITELTSTNLTGLLAGSGVSVYVLDIPAGDVVGTSESQVLTNKVYTGGTVSGNVSWDTGANFHVTSPNAFLITTNGYYPFTLRNHDSGTTGPVLILEQLSSSPSGSDVNGRIQVRALNSAGEYISMGEIRIRMTDPTDGSEDSIFRVVLRNNGDYNEAMHVNGDGTLYVDGTYETFDEHDDALLLKEGISLGNSDKLIDAGVMKVDEDGDLMIDLQGMLKLIAGGVYQNRDYIESLEARIDKLEGLLK